MGLQDEFIVELYEIRSREVLHCVDRYCCRNYISAHSICLCLPVSLHSSMSALDIDPIEVLTSYNRFKSNGILTLHGDIVPKVFLST